MGGARCVDGARCVAPSRTDVTNVRQREVGAGAPAARPPGHDAAAAGVRGGARTGCGTGRRSAARAVDRPERSTRVFRRMSRPFWGQGGRGQKGGGEEGRGKGRDTDDDQRVRDRARRTRQAWRPGLPSSSAERDRRCRRSPLPQCLCRGASDTLSARGYAPDPRCPCSRLTLPSRNRGVFPVRVTFPARPRPPSRRDRRRRRPPTIKTQVSVSTQVYRKRL